MNPLDGQPLLVAAAKASVGPRLLPDLVEHVQDRLGPRLDEYRREYERVHEGRVADHGEATREVFLVEPGHWTELGEEFRLEPRERDAVERAHAAQLRHLGRDLDRREEFERALEVREVVVIGV